MLKTSDGDWLFAFKVIRLHLRQNISDHLGDVTGNVFMVCKQPFCESVCSVDKHSCVAYLHCLKNE